VRRGNVLRGNSVISGRIAESNFVFESERATIMKNKSVFRVQGIVLIAALIAALPGAARAERLGTDVIGMFPKDLGAFAYADLKAARSQKQLSALEARFLPGSLSQIQKRLASYGIDILQQADEAAWGFTPAATYSVVDQSSSGRAATGEQIVGIAIGQYNPESSKASLKQNKIVSIETAGVTLFALQPAAGPNDLFFAFLDSNTLAFGYRAALQKMLEVRAGMISGLVENAAFFQLIDEANGSGALWAVLDPSYSKSTITQIAPDLEKFAQSSKLLKGLKNLVVKVDADGGMQGQVEIVLGSTDDANLMGQLLQIGLLYESSQATGKQNKSLADLLSRTQIFPSGDRVTIRLSVNEAEVVSLPGILAAGN